MKKVLPIISLFLFGVLLNANAQSNFIDVMHLKNGSIIRGVIVEQVPNEQVKIQTADGSLFVYRADEIEKLTREPSRHRSSMGVGGSEFHKPQGYMGLIEAGSGLGVGDWRANRLSLTMVNGYRFIPQFAIGLGVGVEWFIYKVSPGGPRESDATLPIFLHLRSDLIAGRVSPYFSFDTGYSVNLSGQFFEGLLLEPSFGISFNDGRRNRMTIGLGFAMNRIKYYYIYHLPDGYQYGTAMGNAVKLKLGISF